VFPTYILAEELWLDLKAFVPRAEVLKILNSKPMSMTLRGGIHISVRSADHPDHLVSAGIDLLYMIEAARMQEEAWLNIRPTLISEGRLGKCVFNSTPKGRNWFARLWDRCEDPEQLDWEGWRIPAFLEDEETRHPYSVIPDTDRVLAEKDEHRDRWFAQEYMAQFLGGEGQVFRDVAVHIQPAPAQPKHPVTVGVDLAKRVDFTVFAAVDAAGRMIDMERMQGISYELQGERLCGFCHRVGAKQVVVEANGPGEPFIDRLKTQLYEIGVTCEVISVTTTSQSKEQMISALAYAFERSGAITILDDPVLRSELEAYEGKSVGDVGRQKYGAPEGFHDDCVMALALAWTAVQKKVRRRPPGSLPGANDGQSMRKTPYGYGLRGKRR